MQPYSSNLQSTLRFTQRIQENVSIGRVFRDRQIHQSLDSARITRLDPASTMSPSIGTALQPKNPLGFVQRQTLNLGRF